MAVLVGITCGWEPGDIVAGWPSVYVNKDLCDRIAAVGGVPLIVPVSHDAELLRQTLGALDALVLAGETRSIGTNVMDAGESNILRRSNPQRYDYEVLVIQAAMERHIPILGICRGFQMLNALLGGVVTDNDIHAGNDVVHQQAPHLAPDATVHTLDLVPGTLLQAIVGKPEIAVNSFHRQGTARVAPGFTVAARSADGNIEAFEAVDGRFAVGVQYHPEMLHGEEHDALFRAFIAAARA